MRRIFRNRSSVYAGLEGESSSSLNRLPPQVEWPTPSTSTQTPEEGNNGETPYVGEQKLVVCFDVGTTQSGVSVMHLQPGAVPKVRVVSRWPGDSTTSKIPSILYYHNGSPKSYGAESQTEELRAQAEEEEWEECRWFKLHLHPHSMLPPPSYSAADDPEVARDSFEVPPLPKDVTIGKVYEDWFRYLFNSTKTWFGENSPDGSAIWEKLASGGQMVFVVAHPNGWGIEEQAVLKAAMEKATLIKSDNVDQTVFVTEAEASVYFGLHYVSATSGTWLEPGREFMVVDLGGSTADITTYTVEAVTPKLKLRELKASACIQAGAIFPTRTARTVIQKKLEGSRYCTEEYINRIIDHYDRKTKTTFVSPEQSSVIKFGFNDDTDVDVGILKGRLTLTGEEVETTFKPTTDAILKTVDEQLEETKIRYILLSGGFGESPYLQRLLRETYAEKDVQILTSDEPAKKAVAEGAALFYVRDAVVARAARVTFGTDYLRHYEDHRHDAFNRKVRVGPDGVKMLIGGWQRLLKKGTILQGDELVRTGFTSVRAKHEIHEPDPVPIIVWTADQPNSSDRAWFVDEDGVRLPEFTHICTIQGDLAAMASSETWREQPNGEGYYKLTYDVAVSFGGTSLKAFLIWKDGGVEKRGEATIVPANLW